jgi:hypothetical protein
MKIRALAWTMALLASLAPAAMAGDEPVPEFDGGYIATRKGELIELESIEGMNNSVMGGPGRYFSLRRLPELAGVRSREIRGFAIRGKYDFAEISLTFLVPRSPRNPGEKPDGYVSGFPVEFRKKSIGPDSYYIQPRGPLPAAEYILWSNQTAWPFRVDGMDCAASRAGDALAFAREWAMSQWGATKSKLPAAKSPAEAFETWELGEGRGHFPENESLVFLEPVEDLPGGHVAVVKSVRKTEEEIGDNQVARYLAVRYAGPRLDGSEGAAVCDEEWRLERTEIVREEKRYPIQGVLYSALSFDCERKQREATDKMWEIMREVSMSEQSVDTVEDMLPHIRYYLEDARWYDFKLRKSERDGFRVRAESRAPGISGRGAGDDIWEMDERGRANHIVKGCFR